MLRVRIGEGLTGWVALTTSRPPGRRRRSTRGAARSATSDGPESMLLVPMTYEYAVQGVIVLSKLGYDRFDEDDERTLEIFAGYAAQALVNAEAVRPGPAASSRSSTTGSRASGACSRSTSGSSSTLDPLGVLEMIADSLKAVVTYDSLTIYRVDRDAWVRRAVVARDRFADLILQHEGPLDAGITGWAIPTPRPSSPTTPTSTRARSRSRARRRSRSR